MRDLALLTSSCLPPFHCLYQNWKDVPWPGIESRTSLMNSTESSTELRSPVDWNATFMHNRWLMAQKSLNMIEKMMVPNIIEYYIINCAIPSIITIKNRYQIDFGKPAYRGGITVKFHQISYSQIPHKFIQKTVVSPYWGWDCCSCGKWNRIGIMVWMHQLCSTTPTQ